MADLKPCPFCGTVPTKNDAMGSYVYCYGCGAEGPVGNPDKGVERWNVRAALPPTLAEALKMPEIAAMVEVLRSVATEVGYTAENSFTLPLPTPNAIRARAALRALEAPET